MKNITKRFGKVVANNRVSLSVREGEILSILGENGSGKTTLMNMIAGIYFPDEGQIFVRGREVVIRSPRDAYDLKIGMIHQHFKLVDVFSAAENIVLGLKEPGRYDIRKVASRVREISERYGFDIDPEKKIHEMSVSEKQTVEIVKVLYRGADILILDEPTAVLTPQETRKLFAVLRRMRDDGKAILIITHKLYEVLALSDRVAVLRKGEFAGEVESGQGHGELPYGDDGRQEDRPQHRAQRARAPAGSARGQGPQLHQPRGRQAPGRRQLHRALGRDPGHRGHCGQRPARAAGGHRRPAEGRPGRDPLQQPQDERGRNLRDKTPLQIRELGVRLSFVPEDRLGMGLVGNMDIVDNMMLRSYRAGRSVFLQRKEPKDLAKHIIEELEVVTPGANTPVRRLSGGNVQKVLVGREIAASPTVLMAAYPVRGLDINSSYTIYKLLGQQKEQGVAVIYVGEDLDVLLELCDRILVIGSGRVTGILDARSATKEQIGLLMTKTEGVAV